MQKEVILVLHFLLLFLPPHLFPQGFSLFLECSFVQGQGLLLVCLELFPCRLCGFPLLLATHSWRLLLLLLLSQHRLVGHLSQLGNAARQRLQTLSTTTTTTTTIKMQFLSRYGKHTFMILFFSSAERCLPAFSSLAMRS